MKIEIWSDFACPFCYLGDKKMKMALSTFENHNQVEIEYKSFQLDVNATSHPGEDIHMLISRKYKISYEQAKASNNQIIQAAKEVGLTYNFDILKPNNTGLAHQVAKYARSLGKEDQMVELLFKAYFEEGYDLGDIDNLLSLASKLGINKDALRAELEKETYALEVMKDQEQAKTLGIQSVPYFVFENKYAVSGAQSIDHFKQVIGKLIQV